MSAEDGGFLSPRDIYEQITGGKGKQSLLNECNETSVEQMSEQERADMVLSLAKAIREGWQGEASAGAYGTAMPLAERMIGNALDLKRAKDLLEQQYESFQTVYHRVRPISDPPKGSVDEKFPFDVDHEIAVKKYRDDAQNNLYVFGVYDEASHYNEINMPQEYRAGSGTSGGGAVDVDPGDVIKIGDPGPGEPRAGEPRPGGPGPGGQFTDSPYRGSNPGGYNPGPGGSVGGPGSQTSPNDYRPSPPPSRYPFPTYPEPGQPSPVSGGPGFGGGVPVGGYTGGGGPGTGGFGPRGSGPRGGPGIGGGPGPGSSGGPSMRGPGGGVGAGALAAEEAAARRAAQAAGARPGMGPMGAPMGTGRGKNDEDDEHQRKVLIESDGEAMFGSDVMTAPQVIGDDEYED
jgi:hypothetical protein